MNLHTPVRAQNRNIRCIGAQQNLRAHRVLTMLGGRNDSTEQLGNGARHTFQPVYIAADDPPPLAASDDAFAFPQLDYIRYNIDDEVDGVRFFAAKKLPWSCFDPL